MELYLPYLNKIDLAPLVSEEIRKAISKLGMQSHEDVNVEVSMQENLILTIRVGPAKHAGFH